MTNVAHIQRSTQQLGFACRAGPQTGLLLSFARWHALCRRSYYTTTSSFLTREKESAGARKGRPCTLRGVIGVLPRGVHC